MMETSESKGSECNGWGLPLALALVLATLVGWRLLQGPQDLQTPAAFPRDVALAESDQTVTILVDFGEGETLESTLPWKEGAALEALQAAALRDSRYSFESRGEGPTAFVTLLGQRANEGAGGRNWLFEINGRFGDQSAGIAQVYPGDRVLWKFALQE